MHLLLLGASGGCGRWVARLAPARGHRVTAIVRTLPPGDAADGITYLAGDVRDPHCFERALAPDVDAVVSCLGIRRRNPRNPWSPILGTPHLVAPVARALVDLMPRTAARRVVAISSAGVADSAAHTAPLLRWVFDHSNVRVAFDDLAEMEGVLAASALDWVAVRPTRLVDGGPTGRVRACEAFRLTSSISRGDVVAWLLDAVEGPEPASERTPMITER